MRSKGITSFHQGTHESVVYVRAASSVVKCCEILMEVSESVVKLYESVVHVQAPAKADKDAAPSRPRRKPASSAPSTSAAGTHACVGVECGCRTCGKVMLGYRFFSHQPGTSIICTIHNMIRLRKAKMWEKFAKCN